MLIFHITVILASNTTTIQPVANPVCIPSQSLICDHECGRLGVKRHLHTLNETEEEKDYFDKNCKGTELRLKAFLDNYRNISNQIITKKINPATAKRLSRVINSVASDLREGFKKQEAIFDYLIGKANKLPCYSKRPVPDEFEAFVLKRLNNKISAKQIRNEYTDFLFEYVNRKHGESLNQIGIPGMMEFLKYFFFVADCNSKILCRYVDCTMISEIIGLVNSEILDYLVNLTNLIIRW